MKQYAYITDGMWAIMEAVAKGRLEGTPLWHLNMAPLKPMLDSEKRAYLYVNSSGDLDFTRHGRLMYERRKHAQVQLRNPEGQAYKRGLLPEGIQTLMSQRAVRAIEREVKEASRIVSINRRRTA